MRQEAPAFGHHLGEISKAELVSQIPAHAEHDDLLVKVPALEESVHFRLRSSALSFDRFANDYAVSKQFAPEPSNSRWRFPCTFLFFPAALRRPQLALALSTLTRHRPERSRLR